MYAFSGREVEETPAEDGKVEKEVRDRLCGLTPPRVPLIWVLTECVPAESCLGWPWVGAPGLPSGSIQTRGETGQLCKGALKSPRINTAWFPVLLLNLGKRRFYIKLNKEL